MGRRTLYGCNKGAFLVIVRTSTGVFQGRNKEEKDTKVAEDRESRENEGSMYGYGLEEILPVVIYLTNKYTSGESSSVPYEKGGNAYGSCALLHPGMLYMEYGRRAAGSKQPQCAAGL